MSRRVRLSDGTSAVIEPFTYADRELLRESYEHLSPQSQYHRFLTAVPHLTEGLLHHLVDEVDQVNHVALILVVMPRPGEPTPVAIARVVRYPDRHDEADVAVTVLDEWHGKGIATLLLDELMRQRPEGVVRLRTQVAQDNPAAVAMLQRLGPTTVTDSGPYTFEVVTDVSGRPRADDAAQDSRDRRDATSAVPLSWRHSQLDGTNRPATT